MLPTLVALVPYSEDVVSSEELLHVAAALQIQVVRDLAPVWHVSGIVSPFTSLEQVPPGYLPLVIVKPGALPQHELGFHVAPGGRPMSLIEPVPDGWSLPASHELLEMLCDPWGNRTVSGPSPVDGQGEVEYLVEVSDPCQHETYAIGGVLVSDFVTPDYYGPAAGSGSGSYSFTGAVTGRRQVLAGGYVTWCVRGRGEEIWQAQAADDGTVTSAKLEGENPRLTRSWVDARPDGPPGPYAPAPDGAVAAAIASNQPARAAARAGARANGQALRAGLERLLSSLQAPGAAPGLDAILTLLERLATDTAFWQSFADEENRAQELRKLGLDPAALRFPSGLPEMERYRTVLAALRALRAKGAWGELDPGDIPNVLAVAMHGMTG